MRRQNRRGIKWAQIGPVCISPARSTSHAHATGFAHLNGSSAFSFSSPVFRVLPKQCAVQRVASVFMAARRPGSKRMSYYNNVRSEDFPVRHRQGDSPATSDVKGMPSTLEGNGVASQGNGAVVHDTSSQPVVNRPPARSLPITLFGLRFNVPGRFILMLVPFFWSSYSICLKWLYRLDWALSPPVFNSLRLVLAAAVVLPSLFRELRIQKKPTASENMNAVIVASIELGFWTILVNVIQAYGLRFTSASRGAFLGQLSTVIVPIAAFATGLEKSLGWNVCLASVMAMFGVGLLTFDGVGSPFSWKGDGVMLSTAFVAAAYILRSKIHAEKAQAGPLVPLKVIFQAVFALLYLGITSGNAFNGFGLTSLSSVFAGATPLLIALNVGIILWAGLFVSVASTILQIRGQALVSASEAVVIFSLTPLCASVLAIPLGERFGLPGLAGAALILLSTLLASRSDLKPKKAQQ